MTNERKLIDEIKLAVRDEVIAGYWNGRVFISNDNKTYTNIISNCQPIGIGFIVSYQDKWLLVVGSSNAIVRKDIINSKRGRKKEEKVITTYPVVTLLNVDAPPTDNLSEYWLTGNDKYSRKLLSQLNLTEHKAYSNKGFICNLGNNKFFLSVASHDNTDSICTLLPISRVILPFTETYKDKTRWKQEITTILPDGTINKFEPDIWFWTFPENVSNQNINGIYLFNSTHPSNTNLFYLGNAIWQSPIENGLGISLNNKMNFASVGSLDPAYLNGRLPDGRQYKEYIDSIVLPQDKNTVVHDNEVEQLPVSLNVEIPNASDNFRNRFLSTWFPNKYITYTVYLPSGESEIAYSAGRYYIGSRNLIYQEVLIGEFLALAWKDYYITQSINYNQITTYTPTSTNSTLVDRNHQYITNNKIYLKDYKTHTPLELNSNDKFLVITYSNPDNQIGLEDETFTINVNEDLTNIFNATRSNVVHSRVNSSFDITSYVGESFIMSTIIEDKPYLIRCTLTSATYIKSVNDSPSANYTDFFFQHRWGGTSQADRFTFTFSIDSKQRLPNSNYLGQDAISLRNELPFPFTIILDNGCFWNYYLSSFSPTVGYANDRYPYIYHYWNSTLNMFYADVASQGHRFAVQCDQSLPLIPINPASKNIVGVPWGWQQQTPANILATDNLIGKSIYRILDWYYLQRTHTQDNYNKLKQIPIAEWNITDDGNIKYKRTFLVDYDMRFPYYTNDPQQLNADSISTLGFSYYPDK